MTTVSATVDLKTPPAEPPPGCEDELMWRTAYRLFVDHEPNPCPACDAGDRCEARWLAQVGLATAMGEMRLMSDYWRGLIALRRIQPTPAGNRRCFETHWLALSFENEPVAATLARRDVCKLFRFLRARGWPVGYIAGSTGITEAGVRAIFQDKRQVTNYDVLARICEGLGIAYPLMGLGRAADH